MRKPETIEKLYLDFDGFFASVMQQAIPRLRGRPVGVIPFPVEGRAADTTVVIACSKEAKAAGCKNVMPVPEALALCPDLILVPQRVDLYRRAHNALLNEIRCETPIEVVKSIDEMACKLDGAAIADPAGLAARIKDRIRLNVGPYITCSIGFAANRLLSKIACKMDKPNGVTVWRPEAMPAPLLVHPISIVPGIGPNMEKRVAAAGIKNMIALWNSQPKHLRAIWKNVNGERMWYALHGYDLHAQPTKRGMFALRQVQALTAAISEMFAMMERGLKEQRFETSQDMRVQISPFLTRFDALFTLNQDLLLERHYFQQALLAGTRRWAAAHSPGMGAPVPSPAYVPDYQIDARRRPLAANQFRVRENIQSYFKLHGSANWVSNDGEQMLVIGGNKHEAIAASPLLSWYWEQFNANLCHGSTKLMVIGYSFSDPHVNAALIAAASTGLQMFIIDPAGPNVLDHRDPNQLIGKPVKDELMEALQPTVIGSSRRDFRQTFGNDPVEHAKVISFFDN